LLFHTNVLLCAVILHERTDWKLKYVGPPKPADVVKTVLQLLYNLTAELSYTVIGCKVAELLLARRKEAAAEPGAQRSLSVDCIAPNRQERANHLEKQLGKTAWHSYSYECLASPSSGCADCYTQGWRLNAQCCSTIVWCNCMYMKIELTACVCYWWQPCCAD